MIIDKILNNNFLIVKDEGKEKIVMGRGIAFGKKIGQKVDQKRIQKSFFLSNSEFQEKLFSLVDAVPLEIFQVIEELVELYQRKTKKEVNESIYITLSDHLNFALSRKKAEYLYKSVLIWDIEYFYPEEYEIGVWGVNRINTLLDVQLPDEEASFITLHLLGMDTGISESGDIKKVIETVQDISDIIRYHFGIDFDYHGTSYQRLITHLRFFSQRVLKGELKEATSDQEEIVLLLQKKYSESYKCVRLIEKYMEEKHDCHLTSDEKMYLVLHIQRIVFEEK